MNNIQIFKNDNFGEIRTTQVNGEPWFCLTDVCKALEITHTTDVKTRLKEDGVVTSEVIDRLGRKQKAIFVNESNLYKTIFQSRKESAERFSDWVTSEVLPSIRKNGAYMTDDTLEKALTSPDFLIKLATQLKEEKEARIQAEQTIEKQKPLVDFASKVSDTTDLVDMSQMAKLLADKNVKIGRNKLFAILRTNGVLRKNNEPYQKYIDKDYFEVKESTFQTETGKILKVSGVEIH